MLYWIQILPPIGGATSMDFFTIHIACLIAALRQINRSITEIKTQRPIDDELCTCKIDRLLAESGLVSFCPPLEETKVMMVDCLKAIVASTDGFPRYYVLPIYFFARVCNDHWPRLYVHIFQDRKGVVSRNGAPWHVPTIRWVMI